MRNGSCEYPLENESALPKKPFGFGSFETVTTPSDGNSEPRPNSEQPHENLCNSTKLRGESTSESTLFSAYTYTNVYKCTSEGVGVATVHTDKSNFNLEETQDVVLSIRVPRRHHTIFKSLSKGDKFVFKELVKAILEAFQNKTASSLLGVVKLGSGTVNLNINIDAKLQQELEATFSRRDSIRELKEQLKRKDEMIRELERENDRLREEVKELGSRYSNMKNTYEAYRYAIIEIMNRHPNLRGEIMEILRKNVRGKQLWTFMEGREAH